MLIDKINTYILTILIRSETVTCQTPFLKVDSRRYITRLFLKYLKTDILCDIMNFMLLLQVVKNCIFMTDYLQKKSKNLQVHKKYKRNFKKYMK